MSDEKFADAARLGTSLMEVVGRVAGHRLALVLEAVHEKNIKPLMEENAKLREEVMELRQIVADFTSHA